MATTESLKENVKKYKETYEEEQAINLNKEASEFKKKLNKKIEQTYGRLDELSQKGIDEAQILSTTTYECLAMKKYLKENLKEHSKKYPVKIVYNDEIIHARDPFGDVFRSYLSCDCKFDWS